MLKGSTPKLVVKTTAELLSHKVEYFVMPSVWKDLPPDETGTKELHEFAPGGGQVPFISTWDIKIPFSLKIISADHVNVAEHYKVGMFAAGCVDTSPRCGGVLGRIQHAVLAIHMLEKSCMVNVTVVFIIMLCALINQHCMCVCVCLQVYLRCGLYHGGEPLCAAHTTRPELSERESCHWNENLEFDLNVCDIPRSAKLCYVLYSSRDSQAKKKKRGAQKEVCRDSVETVCQVLPP